MNIIPQRFYQRDALEVAPEMLGKLLVRRFDDGRELCLPITEVEVYRGEEDLACHASKGRTRRTEIMYHEGGHVYMYLIYGMYWMLNIVVSVERSPQALLVRGMGNTFGPGRVGRILELNGSFYGHQLWEKGSLFMIDPGALNDQNPAIGSLHLAYKAAQTTIAYVARPRIGIQYAGEPWLSKPWRFTVV